MDFDGSSESPEEPKKGRSKIAKKSKESVLKQKSPAEFFAENKNIAGFDNPGKSLYTTVRELVENSLDSNESISQLPDIEITIEEISKSKFNTMIGLVDRDHVDEELYDDFESAKAREKRLVKEARTQEIQAKNAALGKKLKESTSVKGGKGRSEASFFRVSCKDNGRGIPHDDIPNMFGRETFLIFICMRGENKNEWHGAEIQIIIEGNWTTYRSKILHYMHQMAVITPYAQFLFKFISDMSDKNVTIRFAQRTDVMPSVPAETKHHPLAVDLLLMKRLIAETSKQNLLHFLQYEFVKIGKSYAERLIGEMGLDFSPKMTVKSLHPSK